MRQPVSAALLLAAIVLAACGNGSSSSGGGSSSGGTSKHGDKLTVAIGIDPDTLDPAAQTTTTAGQIVDMMAEPLVTIDGSGNVAPRLATSWTNAADGLSYTFTLRSGIKFSDGTDFNAQAVKFSLDRLRAPDTFKSQKGVLGVISAVEAVDATHVKFTLANRFAAFVAAMTQSVADIISPASVNVAPNTPQQVKQPVGTGPYKFSERQAGDHITLVRNPTYWGSKPNYNTQVLRIVPEATSREALVKAGQADVAMLPPANDLPSLRSDSSLKVILSPSDRTIQMVIDTVDPVNLNLQKPEVRQALNYAVDKDAIIKNVLFGAATGLDGPMAKTLAGYCSTGSYGYDVNKARQMLQANGAAGMKVRLMSPTGRYVQDFQVAQAVAGYLRDAGLQVEGPATSDWPTYVAGIVLATPQAQAQKTDLHLLGWAPPYLDASQQFEQFYSLRSAPKGQESSYYKNPEVDALITQGNSNPDAASRAKTYCDAAKKVWSDAPWIFLYNQKLPLVTTAKVTGIVGIPNEKFSTVYASPA
ncbi:MAG: ABC transporter substrate-binding protein [Chloroflexota bacterium]|nr:ABC transporter substrate-binding protein [Chloroflexota bacterium]